MGRYFDQLPDTIKNHVREVTKTSGLPYTEDSLEKIANSWLEKRMMFEEQIQSLRMIEVESLERDDKRGALLLTYSGSLISIGVPVANKRMVQYASIGLRKDVPDVAKREDAELAGPIIKDRPMELDHGPIKKSSPLLKIAVCREYTSPDEQDKRIREATIFLTNGFVKINRTIISPHAHFPDQFTMKSMISFVAAQNGLTKKHVKQIIEDFFNVAEAGVLLGGRVPLGKFGRVFLKERPARKARVGRNPKTGVEITISAKPEVFVPRISFSKRLKEKAESMKIEY